MLCSCGKPVRYKSKNVPRKTCGDYKCQAIKRGPTSDETKAKLRDARLRYMKENPGETAWRKSNMSYPEQCFFNAIQHRKLDEQYLIIRERSVFPFFIDFAFEDQKIAVEIDGAQHNNPDVKEKDQRKDALLKSLGWRIFRVTAQSVLKDIDLVIAELLVFLDCLDTSRTVGIVNYRDHRDALLQEQQNKKAEEQVNRISEVTQQLALINFTIRGWTKFAANVIGVNPKAVRRWMKREIPEFYNERCLFGSHKQNGIETLR